MVYCKDQQNLLIFAHVYADVDIGPKDPRFIGAWWLGFVILGMGTMLLAIPLMCFPRVLKPKRAIQENGQIPGKKEFVMKEELLGE